MLDEIVLLAKITISSYENKVIFKSWLGVNALGHFILISVGSEILNIEDNHMTRCEEDVPRLVSVEDYLSKTFGKTGKE